MRKALIASVAATTLAACAPAAYSPATQSASTGAGQCFFTANVSNFRASEGSAVYLRAGRDVIETQSGGGCRDINRANSIEILPDMGTPLGSGRVCVGEHAIIRTGEAFSTPCRVEITRVLTAEEVAALPRSSRP